MSYFFRCKHFFLLLPIIIIFAFNWVSYRNFSYGLENAVEAAFLWPDEGRQIEMLEQIQETGSWRLIQPSYTALYMNLSYGLAFLLDFSEPEISSRSFALASKWVSCISINLFLIATFAMALWLFQKFSWALLALVLMAGQRFHMEFTSLMHPEATMVLFTALAVYSGTLLFATKQFRYWWFLVICCAFALGSKPQVIFLIPWAGLVFLWMLWWQKIYSVTKAVGIGVMSWVLFGLSFLVASPYQAWNFLEWFGGLTSEHTRSQGLWEGRSLWHWWDVWTAELSLGPVLVPLFLIALLFGSLRLWKHRDWNSPLSILWILCLLWILVGGGYIVATSHSFVHRYLMHIHFAFVWIILLGSYWGWYALENQSTRRWIAGFVGLCFFAGIHIQWRTTSRAMDRRQVIHESMPQHRAFYQEIKDHFPQDTRILYTKKIYIDPRELPQSQKAGEIVSLERLLESQRDLLLVHERGRSYMRHADFVLANVDNPQVHQSIRFWRDLESGNLAEHYSIWKTYPDLAITVYQRQSL